VRRYRIRLAKIRSRGLEARRHTVCNDIQPHEMLAIALKYSVSDSRLLMFVIKHELLVTSAIFSTSNVNLTAQLGRLNRQCRIRTNRKLILRIQTTQRMRSGDMRAVRKCLGNQNDIPARSKPRICFAAAAAMSRCVRD
jgi:hypothetical protein